jgi:asparagine synthase (glutamine-hydrolysing)
MAATLTHRGPDDDGAWAEETSGVALGFRRLSIIDLSPLGHQPMSSASGRYTVVFNGEIYNYRELRKELEGCGARFRGQSDTEVLLAAVEQWGFDAALRRYNGMFAIAMWDAHDRELLLARDRFGEKPLYYGHAGTTLLFGSELKALAAHPAFRGEIDREALAQYLRYLYVPAPRSIYVGLRKLPPGASIRFRPGRELGEPLPFWSMTEVALEGARDRYRGSEADAVAELDGLLRRSVRSRMVADVPIGAFLSGGIDSSTVVALMQAESTRPVRSFTIGFHEAKYNEAVQAKAIARHLGTDHTELYVTPAEAQAVIPRLPTLYDEPFADSSQIPTFLVSQLARRSVTVVLSGDGGDELFGGYNRYLSGVLAWRAIAWMPHVARRLLAGAIGAVPPATVDAAIEPIRGLWPGGLVPRLAGEKLQKVASILKLEDGDAFYRRLCSAWNDPSVLVSIPEPPVALLGAKRPPIPDLVERMMCTDAQTYLPDDILVKVDRATMGVSLEGRVPILDPEVARFAARLPRRFKVHGGKGKWMLRGVLERYVPRAMFDRPKMGFGVPVGEWLRGPLREWAEGELAEARLEREGFFDPAPIRRAWTEHLAGNRSWQFELWAILMFQAWHEEHGRKRRLDPLPRARGEADAISSGPDG